MTNRSFSSLPFTRWCLGVVGIGLITAPFLRAAHPPDGGDVTRVLPEDVPIDFSAADFGFSDALDDPPDAFAAVRLTTLPGTGTLFLDDIPAAPGNSVVWRLLPGKAWQEQADFQACRAMACSMDGGTVVVGAGFGGGFHVSGDHGATWASLSPFGTQSALTDVAMTGDGSRLLANWNMHLHISDDAGQNWTPVGPAVLCRGVAMSESGLRMATFASPGVIYISNDGGVTWSPTGPSANWSSIACSADGTRWIASPFQGRLAVSHDGGASWVTGDVIRKWTAVASSADGQRLAACARDDLIWLSDDAGMSWRSSGPLDGWEDMVCSPDGEFLAAAAEDGQVHTSADRGRTWLPKGAESRWTTLALSGGTMELWAGEDLGQVHYSAPQASVMRFAPSAHQSGGPGEQFTFQVVDSGPDGFDVDPTPNTFTLQVTPVDDPPEVAVPVPDLLAEIGAAFFFSVPPDSFTDPDPATILSYGASRDDGGPLPPWLSFDPASRSFSGTPSRTDRSPLTVRLTATDQTGRSVTDDFEVVVAGRPQGTGTGIRLVEETTYAFRSADFGFTDPLDGPADALKRVRVVDLPPVGSLRLNGNPVAAGDFVPMVPTPGVDWSPLFTTASHVLAASSTTDRVLSVRPVTGGPSVLRSENGGLTWLPVAGFGVTLPLPTTGASSADGTRCVVASANGSQLYTSSDAGESWTARESTRRWHAVACSADGSRMLAVDHGETGGFPYVSTDFGVTWSARTVGSWWIVGTWVAAASSADGMKLAIASSDPSPFGSGLILISHDGGTSWAPRSLNANWTGLASSGDGSRLAASSTSGLFLSDDGGETWHTTLEGTDLTSVSHSSDGQILAATARNGRIHVSTNRGVTWAAAGVSADWSAVVAAADGQRLLAAGSLGLYSSSPSIPTLTYTPPENGAGEPYTSMTYQVEDTGPDGLNRDPVPRVLNIDVSDVNDPPVAANPIAPLNVPAGAAIDFVLPATVFSDPDPGESLAFSMSLVSGEPLPSWLSYTDATRRLQADAGSAVPGRYQIIVTAQDQGDPPREVRNSLEMNVLSHPPTGTNRTFTLAEDTAHRFTAEDFGFSDILDTPPQEFRRILLAAAPSAGRLTIDGIPLRAGEYVSMVPEPLMIWPPKASERFWRGIDVSADGTRLATVWGDRSLAGVSRGEIVLSRDGGSTWDAALPGNTWVDVCLSPDGTRILASAWEGPLVLSQDAGQTWDTVVPHGLWNAVAMSADGTHLLAALDQEKLRVSTDRGATWTETIRVESLHQIAMSADGSVMAAAGESLWISTDSGATWTQRGGAGPWRTVVVSDDGWTLLAANTTRLHHSSDRGTTWSPRGPSFEWGRLAGSADATRLVASHFNEDRLYVSVDGGRTWTPKERARRWGRLASSADGSVLAGTNTSDATLHISRDAVPELVYEPSANAHGSPYAQFAFRVADTGVGGSDIATTLNVATFHVLPVDDAPLVANPIPDQSATERLPFLLQLPANTITDPDLGSVVVYSATLADGTPLPSWLAFDPATRTFSGTPGSPDTGIIEIRVTGSEALVNGLSTSDVFQLAVNNIDDPPSGTSLTREVSEDGIWELSAADFGFTDPLDIPPDLFQRVKILTVPGAGVLSINGIPSVAGTYARLAPTSVTDVWLPQSISQAWSGIASSANGARLAAAAINGRIHTSSDAGVTWTARETQRNWQSITSSADGQRLAAVVQTGSIYTSRDGGVTWVPRTGGGFWRAITSSADGSRLAAVEAPGLIHTSTDLGVTWIPRASTRQWQSIASSADGRRLAAVAAASTVFTSDNAGQTWVPRETVRNWRAITSSADGLKLAAAEFNGRIHTSDDAGVTWVEREPIRNWVSITSSSDGARLVAAAQNGRLHHSRDRGATWSETAPTASWRAVASSADGESLAAVPTGGQIHISKAEAVQSIVFTPAPNAAGTPYASLTFQVEDDGASPSNLDPTPNTLTFNVIESNDAPTIDPIPDPPLTPAEAGPQELILTGISDGGEQSQFLTVTAVSSRPDLVADPVVAYSSPATQAVLTYTPAPDAAGLVVITVTVQDTGGTANGGVDRTTRQFTVALTTPFQRWAQENGLPIDPGAEDGRNLVAFAFGLPPYRAAHDSIVVTNGAIERRGLPALVHDGLSPAPPFSVLYGRRKGSGLEWEVQFSSDLSDWQPSLAPPTLVAEDDVVEAFTVPFPDRLNNDRPPQYFRMKLISP